MAVCLDPWCTRTDISARQLCQRHYDRWHRGHDMGFEVPDAWVTAPPDAWPYCHCEDSRQVTVRLFGVELLDVTECQRCRRPPEPANLTKVWSIEDPIPR